MPPNSTPLRALWHTDVVFDWLRGDCPFAKTLVENLKDEDPDWLCLITSFSYVHTYQRYSASCKKLESEGKLPKDETPIKLEDGQRDLNDLYRTPNVRDVEVNRTVAELATELYKQLGIVLFDGVNLSAALLSGVDYFVTGKDEKLGTGVRNLHAHDGKFSSPIPEMPDDWKLRIVGPEALAEVLGLETD